MPAKTLMLLIFLPISLFTSCEVEQFAPTTGEEIQVVMKNETKANAMPQLLDLVNTLRSKGCICGSKYMPPVALLSWNPDLDNAALLHASDMSTNNFFDHTGSDGSDVSSRVSAIGYDWQTVGENIAWGYLDIESVFLGWKSSVGHCKNMMSTQFQDMGSARAGNYWVQTFASPGAN